MPSFENFSSKMPIGENPHWLFHLLEQGANVLLVDCRSFAEYARGHIEGAINLSVSSLMLRRLKKGNISLQSFINSDAGKRKFENIRQSERVVVYDDRTCSGETTANALLDYLLCKLAEDNSVSYLDGGFQRFEECFPHLCVCGEGQEVGASILGMGFSNLSLTVSESVPSPAVSDSNNNLAGHFLAPLSPQNRAPDVKDLAFRAESVGPTEILRGLYLGNRSDSTNLSCLRSLKITHVLNVTHDLPNEFESMNEFRYLCLPLQDNSEGNVKELLPQAFDFMEKAMEKGECVLVHCLGGISRSSTIIIAYLMFKYGYALNEAYDLVKSKKANIAPNFNFMGQLLDLERGQSNPQTPFSCAGNASPGWVSNRSDLSVSSSASSCGSGGMVDSC